MQFSRTVFIFLKFNNVLISLFRDTLGLPVLRWEDDNTDFLCAIAEILCPNPKGWVHSRRAVKYDK